MAMNPEQKRRLIRALIALWLAPKRDPERETILPVSAKRSEGIEKQ